MAQVIPLLQQCRALFVGAFTFAGQGMLCRESVGWQLNPVPSLYIFSFAVKGCGVWLCWNSPIIPLNVNRSISLPAKRCGLPAGWRVLRDTIPKIKPGPRSPRVNGKECGSPLALLSCCGPELFEPLFVFVGFYVVVRYLVVVRSALGPPLD